MKKYFLLFVAILGAYGAAKAQITEDDVNRASIDYDGLSQTFDSQSHESRAIKPKYFAGVAYGGALAFGDDSYNVFSDFKNANGMSFSAYVGKNFSRLFSARINARYLHLYSRVNLETKSLEDLYPEKYQGFFPRDGFYGYDCAGVQFDAMFNLINLVPERTSDVFNLYLMAGVGCNVTYNYDNRVDWWKWETGYLEGGWYEVDNTEHIMPTAMIGGILDFKLSRLVHLNFQVDCTFTGDNLEGVVSEEFYDAYITYSLGLAFHF